MSETTPTPNSDGAIYPDGAPSSGVDSTSDPDAVDPNDPRLKNEPPQPPVTGESGTPLVNEKPEYHEGDNCYVNGDDVPRGAPETPNPDMGAWPSDTVAPDPSQVTTQVNGEMLIANLLVEIANLTKRAIMAETMVQMYRQAAQPSQPKPAQ